MYHTSPDAPALFLKVTEYDAPVFAAGRLSGVMRRPLATDNVKSCTAINPPSTAITENA